MSVVAADRLIYRDLEDLIACASEGNSRLKDFECSIFDGVYIAGRIDPSEPQGSAEDRNRAATDVVPCEF